MDSSKLIEKHEDSNSHKLYYEKLITASDIFEVVQDLIPDRITKTTPTKLYCNCPNHVSESQESLHVDTDKQLWYCFGCGNGGDVIQFVEFINTGDISKGKSGAQSDSHRRARDYLANKYSLPLLGESQLTPEQIEEFEIERKKETRAYQCFTETAYFYNRKLLQNQVATQWVLDNYAISKDTISELKIGYADNRDLYDYLTSLKFTPDEILLTGAFVKSHNIIPLFNHRITFPYWSKGRGVVYMIARKTPWTPKDKHESRKYKKSLVHKEKRPYVSKSINNSTLYNEDCLIKKPPLIVVAEGITDAIAAMEKGFNAISPATVRIKKTDLEPLCKKLNGYSCKIIIVPDNEISKIGLDGALSTARALNEQGLDVRIAELPLGEIHIRAREVLQTKYGIDLNKSSSEIANQINKITNEANKTKIAKLTKDSKFDINEFFRTGHSREDFDKILNDAHTPLELSIAAIDPQGNVHDVTEAINQIMAEISILDPIKQEHYLKEISKKRPNTTLEALRKTAANIKQDNQEPSKKDKNSLNKLLDIFDEAGSSVFIDQLGAGWITASVNNHCENIRIQSPKFEGLMLKKYYAAYKAAVDTETIKRMGILLIEWATETRYLFNRYAWLDDRLLIDMGDKDWHAIEVSAEAWRIVQPDKPPFKRFSHQIPMPFPKKGGDITRILKYISIKDKENIALLLVWLCTCMFEHVARPGIIFHGIHGSCKTSAADFLRQIIDPSSVLHSSLSKDHSEFVQFIDHHAVVSLDNLSGLPRWACDDLCTAVTGGGLSKRSLYTNDDDFTYSFRRVFILNGISIPTTAPDLLDRSLLIELNRLEKKDRKRETKLKKYFEADLPYILGYILDVMVSVIARRDEELEEYTRLADWFGLARIAAETLKVSDDFLKAFIRNEDEQNREVVESHIESQILLQFMEGKEFWDGLTATFYSNLTEIAEEAKLKRDWPKNSASLVKKLKKLSHNLSEMGFYIKNGTSGQLRSISITRKEIKPDNVLPLFSRPKKASGSPVSPVSAVKDSNINQLLLTGVDFSPVSGPVSPVNDHDKEIQSSKDVGKPTPPIPDEVREWNDDLQESFYMHSCWNNESGMTWDEADRTAIEDVKNSPEYLVYQKELEMFHKTV